MVLIKQMLDFISWEIWNVFSRRAFVGPARGRHTQLSQLWCGHPGRRVV